MGRTKGKFILMTPRNGSPMSRKGRLKSHIKFWEAIGAPQYILSTIEHGYEIPFQTESIKTFQPSNRSAYRRCQEYESSPIFVKKQGIFKYAKMLISRPQTDYISYTQVSTLCSTIASCILL